MMAQGDGFTIFVRCLWAQAYGFTIFVICLWFCQVLQKIVTFSLHMLEI